MKWCVQCRTKTAKGSYVPYNNGKNQKWVCTMCQKIQKEKGK